MIKVLKLFCLFLVISARLNAQNLIQNLILNPSCDEPLVNSNIPYWDEVAGANWNQRCASPSPLPGNGSCYFFAGADAIDELSQTIDVSGYSASIDSGTQIFYFHGYVRSYAQSNPDESNIYITALDSLDSLINEWHFGPFTQTSAWKEIDSVLQLPPLLRKIKVRLRSIRHHSTNNDGYYDELYLGVTPFSNSTAAAFSISDSVICPGTCVDFINLSTNATNYLWIFQGINDSVSTETDPAGICYVSPGNYNVTLVAFNANDSDTIFVSNCISVYAYPPPQGIFQSGDTLYSNTGFANYQWYHNGTLINGATNYNLAITDSGDYNVISADENGCEVEAVIFDVHIGISELKTQQAYIISPNPTSHNFSLTSFLPMRNLRIEVHNLLGEKIYSAADYLPATIDCRTFPPGIYFVSLQTDNGISVQKLIKQ